MARPIRPTPILFGRDARLFEARMKEVTKETSEERERRLRNYETCLAMFKAGEEYERKRREESNGTI